MKLEDKRVIVYILYILVIYIVLYIILIYSI